MDEKGKMNTKEYEELIKEVKANSPYKRLSSAKKKWMSVSEMGELLGLKKTDQKICAIIIKCRICTRCRWLRFIFFKGERMTFDAISILK